MSTKTSLFKRFISTSLVLLLVSGMMPFQTIAEWFDMAIPASAATTGPYASYSSGTLTLKYGSYTANNTTIWSAVYTEGNDAPWTYESNTNRSNITKVVFDSSFSNARLKYMKGFFAHLTNLTTITNMNYLNTSQVTSMASVFYECENLTSVSLSNFNTANVTEMNYMFKGCKKLTSLDLSSFNTAKVTKMETMFDVCSSLKSLTLGSNFNTQAVTNMNYMFHGCSSLTSLNLGSYFKTSKVTSMKCMFENCSSLTSLSLGNNFNTSAVTDMQYMFHNCSSCTSLSLGSNFNTQKVTNMQYMFNKCSSLTSLNLGSYFYTSVVTTMRSMFGDCSSLTSLTLGSNFIADKVTDMYRMFYNCKKMTSINVSTFKTSSAVTMDAMFCNCQSLTSITWGSNFNTSNVTNTQYMFQHCTSLQTLSLPTTFNTAKVTQMSGMFEDCSKLTTLTLPSNFTTSAVTSMSNMFKSSSTLTKIVINNANVKITTAAYLHNKDNTYVGWVKQNTDNIISGTGKYAAIDSSSSGTGTYVLLQPISMSDTTIVSVTVSPTSKTYDGNAVTPTVTVKNGTRTVSSTYYTVAYKNSSGSTVLTMKNADTYSIVITGKTPYTNSVTKTLTINRENINLSVSMSGWTYGNTANNPSVSGNTGGGTVTYKYKESTASDTTYISTKPTNAGTYTVKATVAATTNYNSASATTNFTISKANPSYTVPSNLTATYGETLSDVTLPKGWTWADSTTSVGNAGSKTFKANYTPADTTNYNIVSNVDVTVDVLKAMAVVDTAPTAKANLTYTGEQLALVNEGTAIGGTIQYRIGTEGEWSDNVPTVTAAGVYSVYYKVAGDNNHNDTAEFGSISVTVSHSSSAQYYWTKTGNTYICTAYITIDGISRYVDMDVTAGEPNSNGDVTYTAAATVEGIEFTSEYFEQASFKVTVLNGSIIMVDQSSCSVTEVTGINAQNKIKITPNKAPDGKVFDGWYIDNKLQSQYPDYTFTVKGDVIIEAKYVDSNEEKPVPVAENANGERTIKTAVKDTIKLTSQYSVTDRNYCINKIGFLIYKGDIEDLTFDTNGVIKKEITVYSYSGYYNLNLGVDKTQVVTIVPYYTILEWKNSQAEETVHTLDRQYYAAR